MRVYRSFGQDVKSLSVDHVSLPILNQIIISFIFNSGAPMRADIGHVVSASERQILHRRTHIHAHEQ